MAATDALTSLANRSTFTAALERELARSTRSGQPMSLVMFDLDEFKQINDQHGHQAGDEALRDVAEALTLACRDLDTAARYGGEEFVVILPDCGPERSVQVAERLRAALAGAAAARALTASAGVARYPADATDLKTLIRAADDALLISKRTGRNRPPPRRPEPAGRLLMPEHRDTPQGLAQVGVPANSRGPNQPGQRVGAVR